MTSLILIVKDAESALHAGLNFLSAAEITNDDYGPSGHGQQIQRVPPSPDVDKSIEIDCPSLVTSVQVVGLPPVIESSVSKNHVLFLRPIMGMKRDNGSIKVHQKYSLRKDLLKRIFIKYVTFQEMLATCANLHMIPRETKFSCVIIELDYDHDEIFHPTEATVRKSSRKRSHGKDLPESKGLHAQRDMSWDPVALCANCTEIDEIIVVDVRAMLNLNRAPCFIPKLVVLHLPL